MSAIDFVKAHPVGVGVGVLLIIGVVIVATSGGGGTEYVASNGASSDGQVQAGLQLQALQVQASGQAQQVAAQREVALAGIAAQTEIEKLRVLSSDTQAAISANVAGQQIEAGKYVSSMSLANEAAKVQADKDIQIAVTSSMAAQQKYNTDALVQITKIQNKPKGLFSFIFG